MRAPQGQYQTLLIDMDDTLYRNPRMPILMRENIQEYMKSVLRIPEEQVPALCTECYATYGTTMAGLEAKGYKLDYDQWHAAVHGSLPYDELLHKDVKLIQMLKSIPLPKYIFTNADINHANTCLRIMGLEGLFAGIVCFESVMKQAGEEGILTKAQPICCKPNRQAFEIALQQCGATADTSIFVDDSNRNVMAARQMGIFTIQAGITGNESPADAFLNTLHDLPAVLAKHCFQPQAPPAVEASQHSNGADLLACPA